jgi:hypothetical protein
MNGERIHQSQRVARRFFSFGAPNVIQNFHSRHKRSQEPALIFLGL